MRRPHPDFPKPPPPANLVHDPSAATNYELLKALIVADEQDMEAVA